MPKTYWHLLAARRMPTEYELVSTDLLYHLRFGYAVRTPVADFQARHPLQLTCSNWEAFSDPRQTTYASYVIEQRDKESYLDRLLASIDGTDYDRDLSSTWLDVLERLFAPLRYPCHGLHMAGAYVAQGAPAGRIAIAAAFQAGDELRRVQRIAYRTKQLMLTYPDFGANAQVVWEQEAAWQPLRETIERLLVCYEWGEAFTALNLVIKPVLDEFLCMQVATLARAQRDDVLARVLLSLRDDQLWHRAWSVAMVRQLLADAPDNLAYLRRVLATWLPRAEASVIGLSELLLPATDHSSQLVAACLAEQERNLTDAGLLATDTPARVHGDEARAAGGAA